VVSATSQQALGAFTDMVLRFAVDHLVSGTFKTLSRGLFNLQSYYFFAMGLIPIFRLVGDTPHCFKLHSQATILADELRL